MSNYQSWSLKELRSAMAAAREQVASIKALHTSFAESSHHLAELGDDLGFSREAVAANWVGPAGSAATASTSNLQAFSRSAHAASHQSATATRELGHASDNHTANMHRIEDVDTSYHGALARSGGNPAAATADHHQKVQQAESNRQSAVTEAERLDAKGHEYHSMMRRAQWPKMTTSGSTTVSPRPAVPPVPTETQPSSPNVSTTTTSIPSSAKASPIPRSTRPADANRTLQNGVGDGVSAAGFAPGGTGSGGSTDLGTGLGSDLGGDLGGSALAGGGTPGRIGAVGEGAGSRLGGAVDEARVGSRGGAVAGEEGRSGMYGPGGGRGRRSDDEEHRRPDYLDEQDDPWGSNAVVGVPAVLGEEED